MSARSWLNSTCPKLSTETVMGFYTKRHREIFTPITSEKMSSNNYLQGGQTHRSTSETKFKQS